MKKDKKNAVLGGVCAGIANEFDIPVIFIRLIFILAFLCLGAGPLLYIILWLIMPSAD